MSGTKPPITPKTKVGEILDAYPELELVLFRLSPSFEKLRNPVLRKTVARVATLQQVAMVGGLEVSELVNALRKEAGQATLVPDTDVSATTSDPPEWFREDQIVKVFDATEIINSGESPMAEVLKLSGNLRPGEILELRTPFVPEPLKGLLNEKGFRVFTGKKPDSFSSYIYRPFP